ncbi:hypothetical protein C1H46_035306 [Malus baccata]|uniref:Uncharacterized protein n=1 Tax=Malus baccata TaxID=106549 RepID=A0A540KY42_MALBA|nr:hypothetical protein C1H46_035306 [Malus baccata]
MDLCVTKLFVVQVPVNFHSDNSLNEKYPGTLSPVEDSKGHSDLLRYAMEVLEGDAGRGEDEGARTVVRGSKFSEIDVFSNIYVRPRDELAESLYESDDDGKEAIGSLGGHLPGSSRDSTQVCGSPPKGCGVLDPYRDLGSASQVASGGIL